MHWEQEEVARGRSTERRNRMKADWLSRKTGHRLLGKTVHGTPGYCPLLQARQRTLVTPEPDGTYFAAEMLPQ